MVKILSQLDEDKTTFKEIAEKYIGRGLRKTYWNLLK